MIVQEEKNYCTSRISGYLDLSLFSNACEEIV